MQIVWVATVVCNLVLVLLLITRGHSSRHPSLTAWALLSVIMDAFLWTVRTDLNAEYDTFFGISAMVFIVLKLGVMYEGPKLVSVPVGFLLAVELLSWAVKKAGFVWPAYYMQVGLRISNLVVILWFILLFRGEHNDDPSEAYRST